MAIFAVIFSAYYLFASRQKGYVSPIGAPSPTEKPLLTYTFKNLKKTTFPKNQIRLDRPFSETENTSSQIFYFDVPKIPSGTAMDTVSGLMNIPKKPGIYPVIVMMRGYIPDEQYQPGAGTQHVAEELAQNGYITLAPDFLGFGESNPPSKDSFEARFQTYTTALTLLKSIATLNDGLQASYSGTITVDTSKIGIWGHSNGGHVALVTLELSDGTYPTVLWAPVSKSFPYSILYYSDEADDHGKALRVVLANFEHDYDADLFSPINYYSWIKAPISLHQGTFDKEVPEQWSQDLVSALKKDEIDVVYHTYPADHNMVPSWNDAVKDSVTFYETSFK